MPTVDLVFSEEVGRFQLLNRGSVLKSGCFHAKQRHASNSAPGCTFLLQQVLLGLFKFPKLGGCEFKVACLDGSLNDLFASLSARYDQKRTRILAIRLLLPAVAA